MTETDQLKYRNWVFTWMTDEEDKLIDHSVLQQFLEKNVEVFAFQLERGEKSNKLHYQGCFRSKIRTRKKTLLNKFEEIFSIKQLTITNMRGTWTEAFDYATKEDTRVGDTYYSSASLQVYKQKDIEFLSDSNNHYPWQVQILDKVFKEDTLNTKTAADRTIYWISDGQGNTGKSKLTKYLCVNCSSCVKLPFGTAQQIRSSVIAAGPKQLYIIDIPRTIGDDDSMASIISAVEDVKNGFIISSFYGKYCTQMWDPPHVIIFSNERCPLKMMSADRWEEYVIDPVSKHMIPGEWVARQTTKETK